MKQIKLNIIILCNLLCITNAVGFTCSSFNLKIKERYPYECVIYANSDIPEPKQYPNKTDNDIEKVSIYPYQMTVAAPYTHLTQSEYPFCERFENLKKVYISSVESIDANLLEKCQKFEEIRIIGSDMQSLPHSLFSNNLNLITIVISGNNKMKVVPENMFKNQQNLKDLTFNSNDLKFVPSKVFDPLNNLRKLSLTSNKNLKINPRWFKHLENLFELEFMFNEITSLPKNTFSALKKLTTLKLDGNRLEVIHSDSFGPLQNLRDLSLQFNRIKAIDEKLIDTTGITKLNLFKNICSEYLVEQKSRIKSYFRKCFDNYKQEIEPTIAPSNVLLVNGTLECGTNNVKSNSSPWNVELVHKNASIGVFCAGTLLSNKVVVTAANCILGKNDNPNYQSNEIFVKLGLESLQKSDRIEVDVNYIFKHHLWNPNISIHKMDIAVLSLATRVNFNEFIKPICLVEIDLIATTTGLIPGFEGNKNHKVSKVWHKVQDLKACNSNDDKLCGVYTDVQRNCSINGGSGLVVNYNNVYYLRGIVSNSYDDCNVQKLITFTDIKNFYSWIKSTFSAVDSVEILLNAFKIKIKPLQEKYSILQGANFNLTCEILFAYPHPEITWLLNDGSFESNVEQEGNTLIITNATIQNNGAYVCMAKNSVVNNHTMTVIDVEPTYSEIPCGMRRGIRGHIVHGTAIARGEYPWNVALRLKNGKFFCGGTIVSNRTIVTAAHCMQEKLSDNIFTPNDFTVLLGVHNVTKINETGTIAAKVKSIHVHPDWNVIVHSYEADIAVLELENEIQFNDLTHPICLALPQSAAAYASNGTAVGFGRTETGFTSDIAQKLDLPISSYHSCTRASSRHRDLVSSRSFCGGPAGGRGVCDGDSGSGLYVLHNKKFYLRGIVSASLMNNVNQCNVDSYSMFTDAAKFYDWIKSGGIAVNGRASTTMPRTTTKSQITGRTTIKPQIVTDSTAVRVTPNSTIAASASGLPIWD